MTILTIPKSLIKKGDLLLIPRKEYEEFLRWKKIRTFHPTAAQKRDIREARKEFTRGECVTLTELRNDLERRRSQKSA